MIGELPKNELEKLGFKVVTMPGPLEPALKAAHDAVCQCACGGNNQQDSACEFSGA